MTSRAAWISSFSTTSTPMPRASGQAATRIAFTRFIPASRRQRAGRPLRAHQHHRHRHLQRQVQHIRRFLQRRRAVPDDDAGEVGMLRHQPVAQPHQCLPVGEVDRGAGNVAVRHRDHVGHQRGLRPARQDRVGVHHVAGGAVVLQIERSRAERGDRPASADKGNLRFAHATVTPVASPHPAPAAGACASRCRADTHRRPAARAPRRTDARRSASRSDSRSDRSHRAR